MGTQTHRMNVLARAVKTPHYPDLTQTRTIPAYEWVYIGSKT